jgi:hypothetical protein
MQFAGKKGIAVFIMLISGAVAAGFGSGLLIGRQFPAHHYERFGETRYLLDSTTGKVCDIVPLDYWASKGYGGGDASHPDTGPSAIPPSLTTFLGSTNPPPCNK